MAAENFKVKKGLEVGTGSTITSGGINVTGVITATQLVGDGSGLTNVVGSGSGIVVKDEGSAVGTAGTINFVGSGVVASLAAGQATVTISSGGLNDVVDDTTPQLGGGLDLNSKFISGSGGINVTGVVTATTFVGNGDFVDLDVDGHTELDDLNVSGITTSALLNVSGITTSALLDVGNLTNGRVAYVGSTSGRLVDSANLTFDGTSLFVSGINVVSGGTTSTFGADIVTRNLKATGITTITTLKVGTDLELLKSGSQDVITSTNGAIDIQNDTYVIIGQRTFPNNNYAVFSNSGVKLNFNGNEKLSTTGTGIASPNISVSGVGTFSTRIDTNGVSFGTNSTTFAAKFADDAVANFGAGNDLRIYHDDGNGLSYIRQDGTGPLDIRSINDINIRDGNDGDLFIKCEESEGVKLYYEGSEKLEVTNHGAIVTGVCTATSFSGDGSGLTGVTASGTGIVIQHDGSNVGTAGTINFSTNLDVTPISAGIVTVTASGGGGDKIEEGNSKVEVVDTGTGYATFDIDGTESMRVTSGGATIRYLSVGENQNMGNSSGTGLTLGDGGNNSDIIASSAGNGLDIQSSVSVELGQRGFPNHKYAEFRGSQGIFRTNNVERFRYDALGIRVGNNAVSTGATIGVDGSATFAGIVTATTFSGSGASLTTLNASELDSGTIANGRFPATLPAVSGANLTNLPVPTEITVTNEASDQTCNILFTTAATGNLAPKSSSTLTYDANGEVLSATLFSGSGASLTNLNASNIGSGTMSASRLTGALPAISGASLTNVSADTVDIGTANANQNYYPVFTETSGSSKTVNIDGGNNLTYNPGTNTLTAGTFSGSGASLTNLPASTPTTSDIQVVYEITNQSSFSYFRFAGNGVDSSANNPDIYLTRGQKYRFINNSGGSHPFQIQTTGGSPYTTGVTNNNASSGNIDFAIRWDAPSQLKYQCTQHGSMQGNIYISGGESGRRTTAAAATGSIANAAAANISITAAKTYSLLKVQTSAAAWVTLYTDSTSRSNDASRGETTDPTPGSGVIAEVITSGAATQILSPGVIGWNNDSTPSSTVYAKVVNKSGSTQAITVTLHYLQMEI